MFIPKKARKFNDIKYSTSTTKVFQNKKKTYMGLNLSIALFLVKIRWLPDKEIVWFPDVLIDIYELIEVCCFFRNPVTLPYITVPSEETINGICIYKMGLRPMNKCVSAISDNCKFFVNLFWLYLLFEGQTLQLICHSQHWLWMLLESKAFYIYHNHNNILHHLHKCPHIPETCRKDHTAMKVEGGHYFNLWPLP